MNLPELTELFSAEQIAGRVAELAGRIERDYQDRRPVLLCVLKGAVFFCADLARQIRLDLELDFLRLSSYGDGTESSGQVRLLQDAQTNLRGRHVLVVEDIIDSGRSVDFLLKHLRGKNPASLAVAALLDKRERRARPVVAEYAGFALPSGFVVGYGLDCAEQYRNLPGIYTLRK